MTGVDLSPVMVDTARRLAGEQGVGIRFEVGDAENLPYEDASFDVVASALGVFLAPDHAAPRSPPPAPPAGARPPSPPSPPPLPAGGRPPASFAFPPPGGPLRVPSRAAPEVCPFLRPSPCPARAGGRRPRGARSGGVRSSSSSSRRAKLRLTAESGEEMWRRFTSYDGAAKAQVDSLDRRRAEEYRRAYIAHHERHRSNGRISLPRRYLLTLGRRRANSGADDL